MIMTKEDEIFILYKKINEIEKKYSNMERLTLNEAIEHCYEKTDCSEYGQQHEQLAKWLEELKEYKDLEEQELLLRLPCKVGDEFWELNTVNEIPHIYPRIAHSLSHCAYVMERLGKTAFLTKEEAEAALAKMKEGV